MDLSVCITTYNLEKVLDQTLESVFAQKTEYSFEVLIGDDGSSDGTMEQIAVWEEKYPQIIRHYQMPREANKKYNPIFRASANRINLLKHAQGKYITFLDGDDFYIDPNNFQKQISILEKHPQCALCARNMNYYYPDGSTVAMTRFSETEGIVPAKQFWMQGGYSPAEACIMRREALVFDSCFERYFDDNFILFLALQGGDLYYLPEEMANYRQNPSGFLGTEQIKMDIINLLDCDMEIRRNRSWKKSALRRHAGQYLAVYRYKDACLKEAYPQYYQQAQEDHCRYTLSALDKRPGFALLEMIFTVTMAKLRHICRL